MSLPEKLELKTRRGERVVLIPFVSRSGDTQYHVKIFRGRKKIDQYTLVSQAAIANMKKREGWT